ncbi:uncharacterized protein LOC142974865 [Anticarsia gemmatalis]|uniref:uncharacterized protein LOC142974865 n=1 Tax=Anticarsia gemmatalis TaxID=129554 RepID=UPI003F764284
MSTTLIHEALSHVAVLGTGILPIQKGSVGLQFYIDIENVDSWNPCSVRSWPKMCSLEQEPYKDCCTESVFGDNIESVLPRRRETLIYVYPTLYPHDQIGQCSFAIDFQCGRNKRSIQFDVNLPFNTKLNNKILPEYLKVYKDKKIEECTSLDEDVLNGCVPVKCDLKYSGRRPFFDETRRKCISAPACGTNPDSELPNIAYVPESNICRDLDQPLTLSDVYIISTGLGVVTEPIKREISELKIRLKSNCTTISENLVLIKDIITGKLYPYIKLDTSDYTKCVASALMSISVCILGICAVLVSICFCIQTMIYLYNRGPKDEIQKIFRKIKSKLCKKSKKPQEQYRVKPEVTHNLLKEVIVRDLPMELRDSVVELCDRIGMEIRTKKRYRLKDVGSQIALAQANSETDDATSSARSVDKK